MATVQQQRVIKVLERMRDLVLSDEPMADIFAEPLDEVLEVLRLEDAFGTEGQNDPRGDFRDGERLWGMGYVQGLDA
jgi:hypothetical protein